jgi:hypothetical protein
MTPWSSQTAWLYNRVIASRLWLTKTTVRPSRPTVVIQPRALGLELGVAHGQDLVDHQDVGLQVGGDGERQTQVHP